MRKLVSILLIAVFFTAQYARQLAYLECKLAELNTAATATCDCEKSTGIDKIDNKAPLPSKSHTHITIDEFFNSPANEIDKSHCIPIKVKPTTAYTFNEAAGSDDEPYRPPQA